MDKCKTRLGYNNIPPPYTGNFMPPKSDLVYPSLDDFVDVNESVSESVVEKPTVETNEPETSRKENGAPIIKDWVSDSDEENVPKVKIVVMFNKPSFAMINFVKSTEQVNTVKGTRVNIARLKAVLSVVKGNVVKASACWVWRPKYKVLDHGNPQQDLKNKGVIDSECSRYMTKNRSYLTDYEEIDRGFVAFRGNYKGGKITRKGKIKTGKLDFEDVYFVKELKFNLFSVSQMCEKKIIVLLTDTECVVLSLDFKLTDESHVLLKVPRKDNMALCAIKGILRWYQSLLRDFDLRNITFQTSQSQIEMGPYVTSTPNSIQLPILDTEFGDSFRALTQDKSISGTATPSSRIKGRTMAVTAEDMQKRRNDVKARTTLLLTLPDEHQLRFNKYETAKELWEAILSTFGGNEATKKTKKNLLKQQYGNFKAKGSETLEQTFNRLNDQDTISLDDLYNNLKVYESEVQNKGGSITTASTEVASATFSHDTICAYIAIQQSGSQIKYVDITHIDNDDIEEMDIKGNMLCNGMFQFHKLGHFARAWQSTKSLGQNFMAEENEASENQALVAEEAVPIEFALMEISSSSSDNEVYDDSYSSKSCRKNTENLTTKISKLREELFDSESDLCNYKRGLSQVEARLVEFKINESKFCEKIRVLERDLELKDYKIENLINELEEVKKERDGIDSKLEKFVNSSKDLDQMLESQKSGKDKKGVGFDEYRAVPPPTGTSLFISHARFVLDRFPLDSLALPNWFHEAQMITTNDAAKKSGGILIDSPQKEQEEVHTDKDVSEQVEHEVNEEVPEYNLFPLLVKISSLLIHLSSFQLPTMETTVPTVSTPVPAVYKNMGGFDDYYSIAPHHLTYPMLFHLRELTMRRFLWRFKNATLELNEVEAALSYYGTTIQG
ncbi:hypothetical protein Tco_0386272 [Tanacetum coccineum]